MDAVDQARFKSFQSSIRGMPTFGNKASETWREFESRWRIWLDLNEIVNMVGVPKQKLALSLAMTGEATRAVEQHGPGKPSYEACATLEAYITLIKECFNPRSESQTARTDFERRKQGRQEAPVVFLSHKRALYYHAFPEEPQRSFTYFKSEVLKGIYATYVKERIIETDPADEATLETCVADAVGKGRSLFFSGCDKIANLDGLASTTKMRAINADGSTMSGEAMEVEEGSRRVDDSRGKCHTCKKPGHFARDCPDKRRGGPSQGKRTNPDKDVICNECKKKGHRKANCWQLYPHLKKGRKGGGQQQQKSGAKGARRVRGDDGEDGDDQDQDLDYADFDELEGEGANRVCDLEPEHPFWYAAVPQRRGRTNRRN